ncbi:hypothetical protein AB4Z51_29200 [Bradyrhizobium sp. 2TAF36]|uniref:hypothetical protein n=1 Tax=Bradyrhizobium sp. 2TAF36 TaxID=3233016 RepID=UPI003F8E4459
MQYLDGVGKLRTHVFDLKVFRRDGSIVAVDVKPAARVESSGIRETHSLIASQIPPMLVNRLLVFTERMYTPADLYNAELMLGVGRQRCPEDDEAERLPASISASRSFAQPSSNNNVRVEIRCLRSSSASADFRQQPAPRSQ